MRARTEADAARLVGAGLEAGAARRAHRGDRRATGAVRAAGARHAGGAAEALAGRAGRHSDSCGGGGRAVLVGSLSALLAQMLVRGLFL